MLPKSKGSHTPRRWFARAPAQCPMPMRTSRNGRDWTGCLMACGPELGALEAHRREKVRSKAESALWSCSSIPQPLPLAAKESRGVSGALPILSSVTGNCCLQQGLVWKEQRKTGGGVSGKVLLIRKTLTQGRDGPLSVTGFCHLHLTPGTVVGHLGL